MTTVEILKLAKNHAIKDPSNSFQALCNLRLGILAGEPMDYLHRACKSISGDTPLTIFEADHSHAQIMNMWDLAIQLAEKDSEN